MRNQAPHRFLPLIKEPDAHASSDSHSKKLKNHRDSEVNPKPMKSTVSGPDWLTGGAFGAEASVIPVLLGLILSAWYIWKTHRLHDGTIEKT